MQDKLNELLELGCSVFVEKKNLKGNFTKLNSVRLNANMKEEELENYNWNSLKGKEYLIIDMDASNEFHQRKFKSIIKDKKYKTYDFENIKVIVSSSKANNITNEILGLLIIL